jgi:hypothetical protein
MGKLIRDVAYNSGTNTVTAKAPHGLQVRIFAFPAASDRPGQPHTLAVDAQASKADGSISAVLTGLATGSYVVRVAPRDIPLQGAYRPGHGLAIAKP